MIDPGSSVTVSASSGIFVAGGRPGVSSCASSDGGTGSPAM
jgi:hypothetical protein